MPRGSFGGGRLSGDGYERAISSVEWSLAHVRGQRDRGYVNLYLDDLVQRIDENEEWGDDIKRRYADHPTLGPAIANRARAHNAPSRNPLTETQRALVREHLPLVRSLAGKKSYGSHVLYNELVTFGIEFLTDRVRQYDPNSGVTFGAFAKKRLMGAMRDYVKKFHPKNKTVHGLSMDAVEAITHRSGRKTSRRSLDDHASKWSKADAEIQTYLRAQEEEKGARVTAAIVRQKNLDAMTDRFFEAGGTVKRKTPPLNEQLEEAIGRLNQRQQMVYRERVLREPPTPIAQLARRLGIQHENQIARIQHQAERKVAKALAYRFGARIVGYDDETMQQISAPYILWEKDYVDVTATQAMQAAVDNRSLGELDRAKKFLSELLADGPVEADEGKEAAEAHDISSRTLANAKAGLVETKKGRGGKWYWRLAEAKHKWPWEEETGG